MRAKLHSKHPMEALTKTQQCKLYTAIVTTGRAIIKQGGRYDEYNLYNQPGNYIRLMDQEATSQPCPEFGGRIEKMVYLGGAC